MIISSFLTAYFVCGLGIATSAPYTRPIILADTNRDGIVDQSDSTEKLVWTEHRGAIFLPNIGDTDHRCAAFDLNGQPLNNQELAACNDASGNRLYSPEVAAPIKALPLPNVSQGAVGRIRTTPASALGRVRMFWKSPDMGASDGSSWLLIDPQFIFNSTSLRAGLDLALDARELVTDPKAWNGTVSVVFTVVEANHTASDSVALKQAPVLFHHHLQSVDTVLTLQGNKTDSPMQERFVKDLQVTLNETQTNPPLMLLNGTDEIWAQDFMEPGFVSMPGPNGPISLRVLVRSAQSTRTAGRQVFELLRGKGAGGHQLPLGSGFGHEEINSGGNIEIIPPYVSKTGTRYPLGRIIMGRHFDKYPADSMTSFMRAQRMQQPLILETGWLGIGHVDEFVQFLPYNNDLGFTIAIGDTNASLDLLRKAQRDGYGSVHLTSFPHLKPPKGFSFYNPSLETLTIDEFLDDESNLEINKYAQTHIDDNLELLLQEIPLGRNDVLHVPALFSNITFPWPLFPDGLPRRLSLAPPGEYQTMALLPAVVNGLVIGHDYLAAQPWGPEIRGKDIFAEAARSLYGRANMTVHFIDDFMSHHVNGGEVHCGTNTFRETKVAWWS